MIHLAIIVSPLLLLTDIAILVLLARTLHHKWLWKFKQGSLRIEIQEEKDKPTRCTVWKGDRVLFFGYDSTAHMADRSSKKP
jgi:hypothetical protein